LVGQAARIDLNVVVKGEASVKEIFRVRTDGAAFAAQRAFPLPEIHGRTSILGKDEDGGRTVVNTEPAVQADFGPVTQEARRQHLRHALRATAQKVTSVEAAHGHLNDLGGPEDLQ
jgi:hypothetical protein